MERKEFLRNCGFACLGGALFTAVLESCSGSKMISGAITQSDLVVPVSSFLIKENQYRRYIVVNNERLKYPVCVYRFGEDVYTALYMRCPHQGAELQVFGDRLQCPAHGSEFNDKGIVKSGPADNNLRTFPVVIENNLIKISLK